MYRHCYYNVGGYLAFRARRASTTCSRGSGGEAGRRGGEGETIIIHCDSIQVFDSQSEIFDDEEAGSAELGAEIFEFRIRGDT